MWKTPNKKNASVVFNYNKPHPPDDAIDCELFEDASTEEDDPLVSWIMHLELSIEALTSQVQLLTGMVSDLGKTKKPKLERQNAGYSFQEPEEKKFRGGASCG